MKVGHMMTLAKEIRVLKSLKKPDFEVTEEWRREALDRIKEMLDANFEDDDPGLRVLERAGIDLAIFRETTDYDLSGKLEYLYTSTSPYADFDLTETGEEKLREFKRWLMRQHVYFTKYATEQDLQ